MRVKELLFVACAIVPIMAASQSEKFISSDHNISSSLINNIFQNNNGIVWISTEDGLNICDGAKIVTMRNDTANPYSLKSNYTRFVHESSDNTLFISTINGMQWFDRACGRLMQIQATSDGKPYTSNINVSCMIEIGPDKFIAGSSGHGLFVLEHNDGAYTLRQMRSVIPSLYIENLLKDSYGNIWIGTLDNGIFRTDSCFNINWTHQFDVAESMFAVCECQDSNIYIGTSQGRLFCYRYADNRMTHIGTVPSSIVELKPDGDKLLIGTDGAGIRQININTQKEEQCANSTYKCNFFIAVKIENFDRRMKM